MINRLDYKLVHALASVIKEQSFERAAAKLYISQSAISQRIKQLEQSVSQPVLIRSNPVRPTLIGQRLISHFYQIEQLETELKKEIFPGANQKPLTVHIGVNADSLATWLVPALAGQLKDNTVELNLLISDEQYTLDYLKQGEAFGVITQEEKAVKGCNSDYLGELQYALICSSQFKDKHFKNGITTEALRTAPSVAFDQKDNMHVNFIKDKYGLEQGEYPLHRVRSSEAFVMLARNDLAFCLVSPIQVKDQLESGELIDLLPEFKLSKKLFWQRWSLLRGVHQDISESIIEGARKVLS